MAHPFFDKSVFGKYFDIDDADLMAWVDNVYDKLKQKGIVANYILRQDENGIDTDFEDYYIPIVKFFGYLVRLAREFESFKDNDYLANEYLVQNGSFTTGNQVLDELAYLITNSLRRKSKRGSIDTITPSNTFGIPDGELLNLINWDDLTFFKLGFARPEHNSWNLNNSSPLNRSCTGRYDLNLGYEYSEDVEDLGNYPILNPSYVNKSTYHGKVCVEIEAVPLGSNAGIGGFDLTKKIVINPNFNYEITFKIAQDITFENITFGCLAFDGIDNPISLKSVTTGGNSNYFFQTRRLNKAGEFYFVRGILYNKDQPLMSLDNARLNIGFGRNLKLTENTVSIIPYILMDNNFSDDSDGESDYFDSDSFSESDGYDGQPSIYIWNLKVTPASLDYGRCYLNNKRFVDIVMSNKNGSYTNEEIRDIIRRKFVNYNTPFEIINLPRVILPQLDQDNLLLEDGNNILLEDGGDILLE